MAKDKAKPDLVLTKKPDETVDKAKARAVLQPGLHGAITIRELNKASMGELDLCELVSALAEQSKEVSGGNLVRAEAMLMTQASTLDTLFHTLTRRSMMNMGEYMGAAETYMRLALKAQAQARATIETLAEIKNPRPVLITKQANIANGPQQVNNGIPADSRTGNSETGQTGLLEKSDGERLDTGTAGAPRRGNPALATVDKVHRAKNG